MDKSVCGEGTPIRAKRETFLPSLSPLYIPRRPKNKDRLRQNIESFRNQLKTIKNLWSGSLAESMCDAVGANQSSQCWDGEDSAR